MSGVTLAMIESGETGWIKAPCVHCSGKGEIMTPNGKEYQCGDCRGRGWRWFDQGTPEKQAD